MLTTAAGIVLAWSVIQRTPISAVGWLVIALWAVCSIISNAIED